MYSLYFEFPTNERRLVTPRIEREDILRKIYQDMAEHSPGFKIYYIRNWDTPEGESYFDYGSYNSFYVAVKNY